MFCIGGRSQYFAKSQLPSCLENITDGVWRLCKLFCNFWRRIPNSRRGQQTNSQKFWRSKTHVSFIVINKKNLQSQKPWQTLKKTYRTIVFYKINRTSAWFTKLFLTEEPNVFTEFKQKFLLHKARFRTGEWGWSAWMHVHFPSAAFNQPISLGEE